MSNDVQDEVKALLKDIKEKIDEEKQDKKYINNHGMACPVCGGPDIHYSESSFEGSGLNGYQEVECEGCGARWCEVWKMVGITNVEKNIKAIDKIV